MTRCGLNAAPPTTRPLNTITIDHQQSHTSAILCGLNTLRDRGLLLDVTLIAGGESFEAHRVVLASCSDYFRAMFTDEMRERCQSEICLNGISAEGLKGLLKYAYTSRLCLNLENILDILAAAAHTQVLTVVQECSNYLQAQLDLDNCVDVATLAETYSLFSLRKQVYKFMCGHLHQFTNTPDFQRLTCSQLLHLLSCDYPVDCSESQVLQIVANWLTHAASRSRHTHTLLETVNFNQVPLTLSEHILALLHVQDCFQVPYHIPSIPNTPQGLVNTRGLELAVVKVGGFSIGGITNEITYFLPSVGSWKHLTSIPHVEQCNFGMAVLNNELYVVGGCFNQSLQENIHPFGFRYDPQQNKWSTMAPMHRERCRFSLSVVNNKLYAVGGASENQEIGDESSCEAYDPAKDSWEVIHPLPGYRAQHSSATLENSLLVTGGLEGEHVLDSCYAYNTTLNVWEPKAPLLRPRADHSSITYNNKIYLCGGWYEDETTNLRILVDTIDCYDISLNTWSIVTRVPTPRFHSGTVVRDGCLYIIGGFHSDAIFDRATGVIESFDLNNLEWRTKSSYPQEIWEHVCASLYIPRCRDDMDVMTLPK